MIEIATSLPDSAPSTMANTHAGQAVPRNDNVLRISRLYFFAAPWGGVLPPLAFSALGFLVFFLPFVPI
jgi:hypothetical protein